MKAELVETIAAKTGMTKADAGRALDATLEGIVDILKKDGKMSFVGFGTFTKKERPARNGINPLTGKPMSIPAKNVVSFKAGTKLKDAIN